MKTCGLSLALALTLMLAAAGPGRAGGGPEEKAVSPAPAVAAEDWPGRLAGRDFILEQFDGKSVEAPGPDGASRRPHLAFGSWPEVSGRLCNHFMGTAALAGGRLKLFAAATRMMCLDETLNHLETVFQALTSRGTDFGLSADGRTLTLSGDGHALVFRLQAPEE